MEWHSHCVWCSVRRTTVYIPIGRAILVYIVIPIDHYFHGSRPLLPPSWAYPSSTRGRSAARSLMPEDQGARNRIMAQQPPDSRTDEVPVGCVGGDERSPT